MVTVTVTPKSKNVQLINFDLKTFAKATKRNMLDIRCIKLRFPSYCYDTAQLSRNTEETPTTYTMPRQEQLIRSFPQTHTSRSEKCLSATTTTTSSIQSTQSYIPSISLLRL